MKCDLLPVRGEQTAQLWSAFSPHASKIAHLSASERIALDRSLGSLDASALARMRSAISTPPKRVQLGSVKGVYSSTSTRFYGGGREELKCGRVGVLVVAGGQGTRLGEVQPKGMVPITSVLRRSLYQILCEKIVAAQVHYRAEFPLAIMTSQEHRVQTEEFFQRHDYWGLNPGKVLFFAQDQLPLLDLDGDPLITGNGEIALGSNGNGSVFHHFFHSGVAEKMHHWGVTRLCALPIDNPLADPLNAPLIGALNTRKLAPDECATKCATEVCFKTVKKLDAREATGVFAMAGEHLRIVEYTEVASAPKQEVWDFQWANTGEFAISLAFARRLASIDLAHWPLHIAKKCVTFKKSPSGVAALKGEYFNFDLLHHTKGARIMEFERSRSFAPLKDANGPRGPEGVRRAMHRAEQMLFTHVTGKTAPEHLFELRANWYYACREFARQKRRLTIPATTVF